MSFNRAPFQAYILCLVLSSLILIPWPCGVQAHGPKDVVLRYDAGPQTLNVTITHTVSDPRKHYIEKVIVTKNSEPVATHTYTSQPDFSPFTYTYPVEAKAGDVLKVTANCNYFGSETGELTIGK